MQNVHGSDHWPLSCRYAEVQVKRSDTITKMDPKKCMKEAPAILNSNKFTALNVDDENLATKLLDTITEVSNDLKLMTKSSPSHHKRRLTSTTKKAIKTTNVSYRKWKNAVTANRDITITKTLWQEFKEKQQISKKLEIIDARKAFEKFSTTIEEIAEQGCDTDKMWGMVRRVINKSRSSQHTMLLKDPATNHIAQSEERNRAIWMEHFKNLATPDIAESVHQSFWNEREGPPTPLNGPTYNSTENWNAKSLTAEEILLAIKHTNPNKAPGPDQISPAFFAAVCTLTDEERESNKFWTILDRVCKDLFESTNMPDNINEALIVPIPKKGDPTNPGNCSHQCNHENCHQGCIRTFGQMGR